MTLGLFIYVQGDPYALNLIISLECFVLYIILRRKVFQLIRLCPPRDHAYIVTVELHARHPNDKQAHLYN